MLLGGNLQPDSINFAMGQRPSKLHNCMLVVVGQHPSNDYVNICCYEYFASKILTMTIALEQHPKNSMSAVL